MSAAVSIIIPAYNRLWSLPMAVASCRQNSVPVEIIVIDDGSTDGTWEWLQTQKDVIAVKQSNWGKCHAVNKGFELASGAYVRFLDSDDILAANANDDQYHIARQFDADIVTAGHRIIDADGKVTGEKKWVYCDDFIAQQLGECDGSHYSAFIFKKKFLADIRHRPDFAFRDDRLFMLEAALKDPLIKVYNSTPLLHRQHTKGRLQINQGLVQSVQNYQHYLIYRKILGALEESGRLTDRYKQASVNTLWHLAHWVAKTHLNDGLEIYNWVYNLNPDFTPTENLIIARLYKLLGFINTEKLLRIRRVFKTNAAC